MAPSSTAVHLAPMKAVQKKYCSRALMLVVLAAAVLIAFGRVSLGKGLILGTLFSIMNFLLLGSSVPARLGRSRGKTLLVALGSLGGRFVLLAVPMVMALRTETFHIVATIIGIFSVQLMILADYLVAPMLRNLQKKVSGE